MKGADGMKKVLVVDDEPSIVTLLTFNLEREGYEVTRAMDGKTALDLALKKSFDFILLDVMLPKMDGIEITKILRQKQVETPILLLTAKDETVDRIIGLEIGADDYIPKPFSPREVIARMKAISRRMNHGRPKEEKQVIVNGPLHIDLTNRQAYLQDTALSLTKKEFDMLAYFMSHLDEVISRDTLLKEVWHTDFLGESRIVDIHVSHLREKIEENPKKPQWIQTVRGIGYKMVKLS